MQQGVIRAAVHDATRCALAITALLPGINLRNFSFEEENKRNSLQHTGRHHLLKANLNAHEMLDTLLDAILCRRVLCACNLERRE
jgi:hypothetical protein